MPWGICAWAITVAVEAAMDVIWWWLPFLLALVVGGLCPLAGTLLLVQRRLFLANLVSHAVLPGLALALALRLDPGLGGVLSGLAGALLAERFSRGSRSDSFADEAVLNTVLAGFLGLGVLLIPLLGIRVNLEAVLFGDLLAAAPVDLGRSLLALLAMPDPIARRLAEARVAPAPEPQTEELVRPEPPRGLE